MKKLQETETEKWQFSSFAQMEGVVRRVPEPKQVILLLHGLGERGKRIFRKLLPHLPKSALVIAPNAPFPMARNKEGRLDFGHTWYFYDKYKATYFINQDLAKYWLRDLIHMENSDKLPVTIIGFSQGGYLAPLVGNEIPETKLVIGLACEFRETLIHEKPRYPLVAVHGESDTVISVHSALAEREKLQKKNIEFEWHALPDTGHEITGPMGQLVGKILEQYGKDSL